jgi:hypothetical protein
MQDKAVDITVLSLFLNSHEVKTKQTDIDSDFFGVLVVERKGKILIIVVNREEIESIRIE